MNKHKMGLCEKCYGYLRNKNHRLFFNAFYDSGNNSIWSHKLTLNVTLSSYLNMNFLAQIANDRGFCITPNLTSSHFSENHRHPCLNEAQSSVCRTIIVKFDLQNFHADDDDQSICEDMSLCLDPFKKKNYLFFRLFPSLPHFNSFPLKLSFKIN